MHIHRNHSPAANAPMGTMMRLGGIGAYDVPDTNVTCDPMQACFSIGGAQSCTNSLKSLDCIMGELLLGMEQGAGKYLTSIAPFNLAEDLAAFDQNASYYCQRMATSDQSCGANGISPSAVASAYKNRFLSFLRGTVAWDWVGNSTARYQIEPGKTLYDYASGAVKPLYNQASVVNAADNGYFPTTIQTVGTPVLTTQQPVISSGGAGAGTPVTTTAIINGQPATTTYYGGATQVNTPVDGEGLGISPLLLIAAAAAAVFFMVKS